MSEFPATRQPVFDVELIKATVAVGCTDEELALFLHTAKRLGLDPLARQLYAIRRWSKALGREAMAIQIGIDGYRAVAERTGQLDGILVEWCADDGVWRDVWLGKGQPAAAKATIWRKGCSHPFVAVARFADYQQTSRDGRPTGLWGQQGPLMIGKCFDSATEVLTERGFMPFSSVDCRIMQVTASGLEAVDAKPFVQDYDGEMVTLDSDDLNFSVTPNHDMVTTGGKIEAGAMYERARARAVDWIPRVAPGSECEADVSDTAIALAAAVACDGSRYNKTGWKIEVSKGRKIEALRQIGGFVREGTRACSADVAVGASGREIVTRHDKVVFVYEHAAIGGLLDDGKSFDLSMVRSLSRRQARILVDTMLSFDGSTSSSGTRRLYTSRPDHAGAFELAAVAAGYSVSVRRERFSDLSDMPNIVISVSERDAIPVRRWGREYKGRGGNQASRTGMEITRNADGKVWCVTVPSGRIVVRRNGFSMICGNCAEGLGIRRAFPAELSGTYAEGELPDDGPAPAVDQGKVMADRAAATSLPASSAPALPAATPAGQLDDLLIAVRECEDEAALRRLAGDLGKLQGAQREQARAEYARRLAVIRKGGAA